MADTAQNNSNSQIPQNSQNQTNSDDIVANLQSQLTALQNQKTAQEDKKIEEFKQQQQAEQLKQQQLDKLKTPTQSPVKASKLNKERKDQIIGAPNPEKIPYKEVQAEFETPAELEPWMEKKPDPKIITLPKPVEDEYGDILIKATQVPKPQITLPVDDSQLNQGFHHKVADSVRWLAEWCKRNILLYPGRVFFKKNQTNNKK